MPTKQNANAKQAEMASGNANQEANQYDKVFKETLREGLPTLLTEILKMPTGHFKPVHLELQRTIERKADFIGKLAAPDIPKTIAHLEVQAKDERNINTFLKTSC